MDKNYATSRTSVSQEQLLPERLVDVIHCFECMTTNTPPFGTQWSRHTVNELSDTALTPPRQCDHAGDVMARTGF